MQWPLLRLLWWGPTAQAAPCPDGGVTLASIEALTDTATRSFAQQDLDGLHQGRDNNLAALPCLHEPMTPEAAAALHRLLALGAFTEGDRERSQAELQAARALQPDAPLLEDLVLPGHPLTRLYDDALTEMPPGATIQPPAGSDLLIDGRSSTSLPAGAAAVVQYVRSGAVSQTLVIQPGDPLPAPEPVTSDLSKAPPLPVHRPILLAATGATAVAAAVVYGMSWQAHRAFWDVETDPLPDAQLAEQQQRINRRASAAALLGGGVGVLGTLTVVYW